MRVHDLFVTDYDYKILDIEQTFIIVDEDQKVKVYEDKDKLLQSKINSQIKGLESNELKEELNAEIFEIEKENFVLEDLTDKN